jgi:hypothetical protein
MPVLFGPGSDSGGVKKPGVADYPGLQIDVEWIEKVANTPDNDLRAHSIALTYLRVADHLDGMIHRLDALDGQDLDRRPTDYNANWFHFATWATLTVTQNIGNERAPQRLNGGIAAPLRRSLTPAILRARASQGQQVGRALAWGQRLIFIAACLTYLDFTDRHGPSHPQPPGPLPPTPPPLNQTEPAKSSRLDKIFELTTLGSTFFDKARHFDKIWRAFQLYELARDATPADRARLVFGGNLLLTAVEQDLVDAPVRVVVNHIPQRLTGRMNWRVAKAAERLRGVPPQLSYAVLRSRNEGTRRVIDTVWSRLMTDQVLVMALPTETLRVGRDIPPRHPQWPYFPPDLRDLDAPASSGSSEIEQALTEVASHVKSLDRTTAEGRGSAARDWRRWDERMNWAITLLRSRQQDETLYWRPYSVKDEDRIMTGELPMRAGDPSAGEVQPPIGAPVLPTFPPKDSQ